MTLINYKVSLFIVLNTIFAIAGAQDGTMPTYLDLGRMGWKEAIAACSQLGDNYTLNTADPSNFKEVYAAASFQFNWIDLHYTGGKWVRSSGSPPPVYYWDTADHFPDMRLGNCAGFDFVNGRWWNMDCNRKYGVICQKGSAPSPVTTPGPSPSPEPSDCPEGWTAAAGRCYKVVADHPLGQSLAAKGCVSMKADLVSVHSDEELEAVKKLAGDQNLWSGLMYQSLGDKIYWHDRSNTTYIDTAEVPASKGGKHCATIGKDSWVWESCIDHVGYICMLTPDSTL